MNTTCQEKKLGGGKSSAGFTLVELMVVVAISSMIAYGMMNILRVGNSQAQVIGTRVSLQESVRDGMMRMIQEVRETAPDRLNVNAAEDTLTFQTPASLSANGTITWNDPVTYAIGGFNNNQLIRTDSGGNARVIANNVQDVTFTANDPVIPTLLTIRVDVMRQTIEGRPYNETLTGEAKIRNE